MTLVFGVPLSVLLGQLLLGLINGSFYALLSLGLAIIFGLLRIINFAHGAQYMLGAFAACLGLNYLGINYWAALLLSPLLVGLLGIGIERGLLRRIAGEDHLYGLLLTFGLALIVEGSFVKLFGVSGSSYPMPEMLKGGHNLRAGTENPKLMQAFGINVPLLITLTYGYGVALAAFAGVLAAPIYAVTPGMGSNLLIVVFAVVVIGGMGSIMGAIITGLAMGLIEGLTKVFYPEAANTVIFVIMVLVLLVRPAGLFGKEA